MLRAGADRADGQPNDVVSRRVGHSERGRRLSSTNARFRAEMLSGSCSCFTYLLILGWSPHPENTFHSIINGLQNLNRMT